MTREALLATLGPDGKPVDLHEPSRTDYTTRRWEGGIFLGDFGGANEISMYGGFALSNANLSLEVTATHVIGNFFQQRDRRNRICPRVRAGRWRASALSSPSARASSKPLPRPLWSRLRTGTISWPMSVWASGAI